MMTSRALLIAACVCVFAHADPYVLNTFDDGKAPHWYAYEDPKGVIEVSPAPDAAVGDGAARVTYTRTGRWGYWDRPLDAARAAECNAVSFWIRGDGSPVVVVPRLYTASGEARADPVSLTSTEWQRVSIRFAHFYPRLTAEQLGALKLFRITRLGVRQPFHFDIDQVQFEQLPPVELDPPTIDSPSPAPGSQTPDAPVTIGAKWHDDGSGIDARSAVIRVNMRDVTDQCELTEEGFTLRADPALRSGMWHIVTVDVRDKNGNRATRLRWQFDKGEVITPTVALDGANCLRVDGVPHFAIGLYSVGVSDMPEVSALGFNTVHSYRWEDTNDNDAAKAYLDAAQDNGLKVFMGLNRGPVLAEQHEVAQERVKALFRHPAIIHWQVVDEPDYRDNSDSWMPVVYKKIKALDPYHPVGAVLCQFRGCARFIDSLDVVQADYYPIPPHPPTNFIGKGFLGIAAMADYGLKAGNYTKPFWYVAQGHKRRPEGCDPATVREPTYNDLKTSAWLPFCRGARGVIWFQWGNIKAQPVTFAAIKRVVAELNELMPLLTATTPDQRGRDADRHVYWLVKSDGTDTYLVACNYEAEEVDVPIPLPEIPSGDAVEVPTGRRVAVSEGVLADHFAGFETHIYRLPAAE